MASSVASDGSEGSGGGAPTGAAGGDLTGTYPNPTLAAAGAGAGAIGGAAQLLRSVTLDSKGRVTAATATDLAAVTGLLKSTAGALAAATAGTDYSAGTSALATGLVKSTTATGALTIGSAGVDYSKGPWRLFSTVRNGAPAQTLSIPVTDGDNNGIIRAAGVLVSDGTDRSLIVKINGSSTNVSTQEVYGNNTSATADRTSTGVTGVYGAMFDLVFITAKTAAGLRRYGMMRVAPFSATIIQQIYVIGIGFKDTTTAITSIDIDCGNATGLAANTYAMVEEGIVG